MKNLQILFGDTVFLHDKWAYRILFPVHKTNMYRLSNSVTRKVYRSLCPKYEYQPGIMRRVNKLSLQSKVYISHQLPRKWMNSWILLWAFWLMVNSGIFYAVESDRYICTQSYAFSGKILLDQWWGSRSFVSPLLHWVWGIRCIIILSQLFSFKSWNLQYYIY